MPKLCRIRQRLRAVPGRGRATILLVTLLAAALAVGGPGSSAQSPAASMTPQAGYDAALATVVAAQTRVDELYVEHRRLTAEVAAAGGDVRSVAERADYARVLAARHLIDAYITGIVPTAEEALVRDPYGADMAYKTYFARSRAQDLRDAVAAQQAQRAQLDGRTSELSVRRARNSSELNEANLALDRAVRAWRNADARLRVAEHEAAERARAEAVEKAARAATTTTAPRTAPATGGGGASGNARGPGWDALRKCESGGNYAAISPGGTYRGAYQFDVRTWRGLGGAGDPAAASPAEQDLRAQMLFDQRGAQPWPVCGRSLR